MSAIVVRRDEVYGPHARQRLDLYETAHPGQRPVLVWFHGGGFVRGDKKVRANVGVWGAHAGYVTLLPNYRLAPECRWPSGPEDVVAVWSWLQAHARDIGADPQRIVLAGESAGAAHVAAATLMRRFQPEGWVLAGAALLSGPYNPWLEAKARRQFGVETPDPRNDPYFGTDAPELRSASVVENIDAAPFPLWMAYAESDLVQMQIQAGELFARLVLRHGFDPELRVLAGHSHFSTGASLGTDDTSVSRELAAFLQSCVGG